MTARKVIPIQTFFAHIIDSNSLELKRVVVIIEVILSDESTIYYSINGVENYWSHKSIKNLWHTSEEDALTSEPYLEAL
ncbi:hypothetical protein HL273_08830 [Yersinia enterocolitica]|uniref:hypothetical protein n=1 Tax=Yersinia enterocolitica TaxID=630 RepID=UPI00155A1A06|nr:hypothetical protein [Yersinia enterocolitica]MBX9485817.1 hypothetical protein [Yersinia enterocolitica]NQS96722.1 hypothetical protein [Yersinia enterocolitica]NQT43399.1 hypothetical protein [Yersinia enterocolitica]NQT98801.1 hypothetical protein [Yersinia enterocolitica]HDM8448667.1 hypothetical protein [Yersinia enterocolitica]